MTDDVPWHLATLFEAIADRIPDQILFVQGNVRRTYREVDERASRLSGALAAMGIHRDVKVAIYMHNCPEYKEAELAVAKLRAVGISVNYRFIDDELAYLLDNADAEALFFHSRFANRVQRIRGRLPRLRHLIQIDDGSNDVGLPGAERYEALLDRYAIAPRLARSGEDSVITYTGGTTGTPKGVLFTQEASVRFTTVGYEFYDMSIPADVPDLIDAAANLAESDQAPVGLVCAPFMHSIGSTLGFTMTMLMGGTVVLLEGESFSPQEAWTLVTRERITQIVLVGDAIAQPLLQTLDQGGGDYDVSSLRLIASSGVMWSRAVKEGLLRHHDMKLIDFLGSSEGGMGMSVATRAHRPDTARFVARPDVKLLDEQGMEIPRGSSQPGLIATTGNIPHGYYKDPRKTEQTFRRINGVSYSVPGDYATIDYDGTITMLGRGSSCINTGGEKVFAEEVEEALKSHPDVIDCLVVGIPEPRFGSVVTAVIAIRQGTSVETEALRAFARTRIAGYKVPRIVTTVPEIRRGPNGKADYRWAHDVMLAKRSGHAAIV